MIFLVNNSFLFVLLIILTQSIYAQNIREKKELLFCKTIANQNNGIIKQSNFNNGCVGSHRFISSGNTGKFEIMGEPFARVEVLFSDGDLTGPGKPIQFETQIPRMIRIGSQGTVSFNVGAKAKIKKNQKHGIYSGSYAIDYKYSKISKDWKHHTSYAEIEILPIPMTIYEQSILSFSDVAGGKGGGTIQLDYNGQLRNVSGNAVFVGSGNAEPGVFSINGAPNTSVFVNFTEGSLNGPGAPIKLHSLQHNQGGLPTIDNSGNLMLKVGGRLNLNANQLPGNYSGRYSVEIDY